MTIWIQAWMIVAVCLAVSVAATRTGDIGVDRPSSLGVRSEPNWAVPAVGGRRHQPYFVHYHRRFTNG